MLRKDAGEECWERMLGKDDGKKGYWKEMLGKGCWERMSGKDAGNGCWGKRMLGKKVGIKVILKKDVGEKDADRGCWKQCLDISGSENGRKITKYNNWIGY